MPILKSAKKALRRDKKRTQVNLKIRNKVRLALKKARSEKTAKSIVEAYSALDRAAKVGVVHKNKAARLKSRLMAGLKREGSSVNKVKKSVKQQTRKSKQLTKLKKNK